MQHVVSWTADSHGLGVIVASETHRGVSWNCSRPRGSTRSDITSTHSHQQASTIHSAGEAWPLNLHQVLAHLHTFTLCMLSPSVEHTRQFHTNHCDEQQLSKLISKIERALQCVDIICSFVKQTIAWSWYKQPKIHKRGVEFVRNVLETTATGQD